MRKRTSAKNSNDKDDYGKAVKRCNDNNDMESSGKVIVKLDADEARIAIKAFTKYRYLLPTYIASKREEIELIEKMIEKLSKASERM